MLKIMVLNNMIVFKELSDELVLKVQNICELELNGRGQYCVVGDAKKLYDTLLGLSYTYDIELY